MPEAVSKQNIVAEPPLLERGDELHAVDDLLAGLNDGRGGLLAFEADAGLGKSRLLTVGAARAAAIGVQVLRTRGDELESTFAWRGILELLDGARADVTSVSPDAARTMAMLRSGPTGAIAAPDEVAFGLLASLADLIGQLSVRAPVLIVADDAHWLDQPTLRFVRFLLGRIETQSIGILLAMRPHEDANGIARSAAGHPNAHLRSLRPLSSGAVATIVRELCGAESSDAFCARCADVTGGNPFYVHELAAFVAGGDVAAAEMLDHVTPPTISRSVLLRLSRLGPAAREVARALAVLGDGADPHIVAALAGRSTDEVLTQADRLAAGALATSGLTLSFAHPLVRAVVAEDIPAGARGSVHARAATLLASSGAVTERIAAHVLQSPVATVEGAPEILRSAAERAIARGAPASAVVYLERALLEPTSSDERIVLRGLLAEAALASGHRDALIIYVTHSTT